MKLRRPRELDGDDLQVDGSERRLGRGLHGRNDDDSGRVYALQLCQHEKARRPERTNRERGDDADILYDEAWGVEHLVGDGTSTVAGRFQAVLLCERAHPFIVTSNQ